MKKIKQIRMMLDFLEDTLANCDEGDSIHANLLKDLDKVYALMNEITGYEDSGVADDEEEAEDFAPREIEIKNKRGQVTGRITVYWSPKLKKWVSIPE